MDAAGRKGIKVEDTGFDIAPEDIAIALVELLGGSLDLHSKLGQAQP